MRKRKKGREGKSKFREKLDMYDMIIANLIAGNSVLEPSKRLGKKELAIGFSNISSETVIRKYYVIQKFPDYIQDRLIELIRSECMTGGVKINFFIHGIPHKIDWNSQEMINRMNIWRRFASERDTSTGVFDYRSKYSENQARDRIIRSTKYLNESELDNKRTVMRAMFVIEITAERNEASIINMVESINRLKRFANVNGIELQELRVNMIDWVKAISPFSLSGSKEINTKLPRMILTDDIVANFNSYKQGKVGKTGVPLGIDIGGGVVLRKFKEDPEAAENWLISAATRWGKSLFVKNLITNLLADNFVVTVLDYEGDEYNNLANLYRAANPEDVKVVSMGNSSEVYFDPCELPRLTGDYDTDKGMKEEAYTFIQALFRVMLYGVSGNFTKWEESVLSTAIQRMYDTAGVTDDMNTWSRSKGLRLKDVYFEIKEMVLSKEFVDPDNDNVKHKAALNMLETTSIYFEEGGSKVGVFKKPMSANELFKARLIIFSFGMRGANTSLIDPTIFALRQLSVAYVNIQVSNHCKYVKKCFNVKVWEEFQRWGEAEGSADIIANAITGGAKRGDVNFILTNDLGAMIDDDNLLAKKLRQNIQHFVIGKIPDKGVREAFCDMFELRDISHTLTNIAKTNVGNKSANEKISGEHSKYKYSFCLALDDGTRAVIKASLPDSLLKSGLFKSGVDTENKEGN